MDLKSSSEREENEDLYGIKKAGIRNVHFKNWAETYECRPEFFFVPKNEEEIQKVLQLARNEKKNVRVVGNKHSPSDIVCTNGIMISLQYFNKVLKVNKKKNKVKVEAGMLISELNDILHSHNLALSVLGAISDITIGGAISVGTHGTGVNYGILCTYVTRMEIMLADGSTMVLSEKKNPDIFHAAVCGLGSLGIILTVTLQCEPAFNLDLRLYGLSLQDVVENLSVHLSGSDHFRFMWFPYTDNVVVSHSKRTEMVKKSFKLWDSWTNFWEYVIGYYALELFYYISTFFPHFVPTINQIFYRWFSIPRRKIDRSYKVFNFECLFKQYVNEWAIPIEKTGITLWHLREWLENASHVYVHFPIEVRFAKADSIFLSPAYGRDTCYINIIMYRPYGVNVPHETYWQAYEDIMLKMDGRPHWAKAHSITATKFQTMYPFFSKWCSIRKQLDPMNIFVNSYMLRILPNSSC